MNSYDKLIEKWSPVLNESSAGEIKDHQRKAVTAAILENQEIAMMEERSQHNGFGGLNEAAPAGANTGSIGTWDPVLFHSYAVLCLILWHMTYVVFNLCLAQLVSSLR